MSIYLIRHAHAGHRDLWHGHDSRRPLSKRGRDEVAELTEALADEPLKRVLSSPSLRCLQTVGGLALIHGLDVEPSNVLADGAPLEPALALLDELASTETCAALCAHGDLIPEIIQRLDGHGVALRGHGCAKCSVWQLEVRQGRVVSGTYHREPDTLNSPRR